LQTSLARHLSGKRGRSLIGIAVLIELAPDKDHWQG
jgi:hypothetical protein